MRGVSGSKKLTFWQLLPFLGILVILILGLKYSNVGHFWAKIYNFVHITVSLRVPVPALAFRMRIKGWASAKREFANGMEWAGVGR